MPGGEIPTLINEGRMKEAEESIVWFREVFGEDLYLEIMRHPSEIPEMRRDVYDRQVVVNEKILELGKNTPSR